MLIQIFLSVFTGWLVTISLGCQPLEVCSQHRDSDRYNGVNEKGLVEQRHLSTSAHPHSGADILPTRAPLLHSS